LGICLGNHDLNVCLSQIENNLDMVKHKDSYTRIQPILERLFFCAMHLRTVREVRRIVTRYLKEFNLKVVPVNSVQFPDDDKEDIILLDEDDESSRESSKSKKARSPVQIDDDTSEEASEQQISDFVELLANFVATKLEPGSVIGFEHLIKIEQTVFQEQSLNFVEMLMKNKYLFEQKDLKIILLDQNEKDNLNSAGFLNKENVSFRRKCLLAHLNQLKSSLEKVEFFNEKEAADFIDHSIRSFYSLRSIDELGVGSLETFTNALNKENANEEIMSCIKNEQAVMASNKSKNERVVSIDFIIQQLNECPLLENISEFLCWTLNGYSSTYGNLKEFLVELNRKNVLVNQEPFCVYMLETEPDCLLKLTKSTSIEQLKSAIETGDFVNASGHLVSIISIQYKSINRAPLALLVNEIQSSLSALLSKQSSQIDHDDLSFYFDALNNQKFTTLLNIEFFTFICEFISRVPFKLHSQLLFSYIIDPSVNLTNDRHIKEKLFQFIVIKSFIYFNQNVNYVKSDPKVGLFIKLGSYCSISEWSHVQLDLILKTLSTVKKSNIKVPSIKQDQSKKDEVSYI
jgi:hypothetical protein